MGVWALTWRFQWWLNGWNGALQGARRLLDLLNTYPGFWGAAGNEY